MTALAFDFSFADITFSAAAEAGYVGAIGYFSTDTAKDWSAERVAAAHAAGLGVAGAWETTATRATQGHTAGVADAQSAIAEAAALGYPASCPIYFAVDEDTTWAEVADYFAGAMSVEGIVVGAYGSDDIVTGAATVGVPWRWQCEAWSGTTVSSVAHLYQRVTPTLTIPGGGYDEDIVLVADYPWWTAGVQPSPPAPPSTPGKADNDMLLIRTATTGPTYLLCGGKLAPVDDAATLTALQTAGIATAEIASALDFKALIDAFGD